MKLNMTSATCGTDSTLSGLDDGCARLTQGRPQGGQPWAEILNPFGIRGCGRLRAEISNPFGIRGCGWLRAEISNPFGIRGCREPRGVTLNLFGIQRLNSFGIPGFLLCSTERALGGFGVGNPEGVGSFSPGLRPGRYPGWQDVEGVSTLKGLNGCLVFVTQQTAVK